MILVALLGFAQLLCGMAVVVWGIPGGEEVVVNEGWKVDGE